mmetsp:Transcript_5197/g.7891  ORF Transcript_5197/g.7891 Transcript_5197/m.7891 type:complete len:82 (+) Transcript_5197:13-258(+)|eukprot:CAMPEP_0201545164 /NCGR_PEP_ID=MMETSP0173_2-20130828/1706_1 /ASSEMBLY_ACC=CAM_ASM_000268 /TAXON_ID=218659 /ORGANISM="Vexillifera sp., Strain DIVA3 564/2" /LENGTH=81 /DNA_ID=CAMNT_0047953493 /DNA_START=13 /DNA_END=258 /DNA_ORIENTATION=+
MSSFAASSSSAQKSISSGVETKGSGRATSIITQADEFNIDFDIEKELQQIEAEPDIEQEEQALTMMIVKFKAVAEGSVNAQ